MKVPKLLSSVKYNLTVVNSVFVLTGIILLIVGIITLERNSKYDELVAYRFFVLPGLAVGTGVFIIFISLLGSFAAISEKFYFVIGYVVLMLTVLVLELSITIAGFKLDKDTVSMIRGPMGASLQHYESKRYIAKIWDDLQNEFQCCGLDSVDNWDAGRIPLSCCWIEYGTLGYFSCEEKLAYTEGCVTALGAWLSFNAHLLAVTACVLTCIQAVLVGISGWLAWRAKSKY